MSDLGAIVKDGAEDMAEGGERAGAAIVDHYQGIGSELENAAGRYQGVESDVEHGFTSITSGGAQDVENAADQAEDEAAHGASSLHDPASPAGGDGAGPGHENVEDNFSGHGDGGNLAADSDAQAAGQAHPSGQDGATSDPIDLVTGEMFLPQQDLALPGTLPLVLERRHGSNYRHGRLFGATWSSTLDQRVQEDEDGIHFAAADGRVLHYPAPAEPGQKVLPSHGPRWPLTWDREDDEIRIEQGDLGRVLHFPRGPVPERFRPLAVITDRAGNRITVVCDAEALPTDVYHSGGYHLRLDAAYTRGGMRISAVSLADPANGADLPIRKFRYDVAGRLIETYHAGSDLPLVFEYDETDRIVRWADRNGYEYCYHYREDGRVSHAEGSGGYLNVQLDYDLAARTTTQTDALGNVSVHHWNERLQTVKVVDALGGVTLTEKDRYGEILASTDPLGRTARIERDANGDAVRIRRADGSSIAITYDDRRLPVSATGPDGTTWRYDYDERGALTAVTDPTGAVMRYGRNERGGLTSFTDPLGHTTTFECNTAGLPVWVADPRGGTWRLRRDPFGRVVDAANPAGAATRLKWDAEGRLLARENADGSDETWEYDAEGNPLTHTSPAGAVTSYEHGPFDLLTARTGADGTRYQFTYDAQLRLRGVTGPQDRTWRYEYDDAGRLVAETDFNGARRSYTLDAAGQLVTQEGSAGQSISFERDPLGRVTTRTAGQDVYRYAYDLAGQLARAEGPGTILEYVRDPLGRVLSEALNGRALISEYDAAGRRTSRLTPGGIISHWTHDPVGDALALAGTGGALAFDYDAAGRESTRALGPAVSLTKTYDALGRLAAQGIWAYDRPGAGAQSAVGAEGAGGAVSAADAQGSWRQLQERAYAYRTDGLPVEVIDRLRGGSRTYQLSAVGRVTAVTAESWQENYAYDALGNLAQAEYPVLSAFGDEDTIGDREHTGTLIRRAGRTVYEHDDAGRLVRQTRRTLSGQQRTTAYVWDAEDRLVAVTTPSGEVWRYTYDALGRRIAKTLLTADGAELETIWFTWDGPVLAEETRHRGGRVTTLTWDYEPRSASPAAQTRRSWATDATQAAIDTEFHAIVTDLVGTPQELVTPDGLIAWRSAQTLWGGVAPAPGSTAECPLRQPGQYHDAETGLYYNLYRYYDPATAAYLTPDPLGLAPAPNPHAYVINPLREIDPLGLAPCTPAGTFAGLGRPDLEGKPIAAVGRLPDTSQFIGKPGYDVLNVPDWTIAKNDDWINGHVAAGNPVQFVSDKTPENLWDTAANRPTVTGREVGMLEGSGYTWHDAGSGLLYLLPPAP
jgi:RHS repeat-associated protein